MPHGDDDTVGARTPPGGVRPQPARDVAERFTARDPSGQQLIVEKLATQVTENALGGMEFSRPAGDAFQLENGEAVEWVEESTYRRVRTGEILRREEGDHGTTHHPSQQSRA